jgi:lipopolysaccharide export system permease protein
VRTLDRYLAAIFVKNFLLATVALTTLFLFQALLGGLFDRAYEPSQVIIYHLMSIPQIIVQMMPPSVMLATVLTLSGLSRTNELVACFSIGVGLQRVSTLLLSIVFIIACLMLVLQDRILPPTFKRRTTYKWQVMENRQDFHLDIKQDKIWYRSKNLIYNLQRFDPASQTIYGMSVYTFDENFNLVQVVDAGRAQHDEKGWRLMDGTVTLFSAEKDDPFPKTQKFREKELLITETPKDFQEIEKEVDGLRLKELWRYIDRMKEAGADTKSYEVKFHSRISLSFMPLVMCVLGIPFSVRSRREGGLAKDLSLCLFATLFYWIFYSLGLSLGTKGALPPLLSAWLPSLIFAAVAAALIFRRNT